MHAVAVKDHMLWTLLKEKEKQDELLTNVQWERIWSNKWSGILNHVQKMKAEQDVNPLRIDNEESPLWLYKNNECSYLPNALFGLIAAFRNMDFATNKERVDFLLRSFKSTISASQTKVILGFLLTYTKE